MLECSPCLPRGLCEGPQFEVIRASMLADSPYVLHEREHSDRYFPCRKTWGAACCCGLLSVSIPRCKGHCVGVLEHSPYLLHGLCKTRRRGRMLLRAVECVSEVNEPSRIVYCDDAPPPPPMPGRPALPAALPPPRMPGAAAVHGESWPTAAIHDRTPLMQL